MSLVFCLVISRALRATLFEGHLALGITSGPIPGYYYAINAFLLTLQILHLIWFSYILRMLMGYLKTGQVNPSWGLDRSPSKLKSLWMLPPSHPCTFSIRYSMHLAVGYILLKLGRYSWVILM